MKLRNLLPVVLLAGGATVVLTASDLVAGTGTQVDKNPSTRLGAELSKDLTDSQRAMAEKARQLDMKQRMLEATSNRIQSQPTTSPPSAQPIAAAPQQAAPNSTAAPNLTAAPDQILNLVKVYQSMKPRAAAAVFEELDLDLQVAVASRMRSQAMAAIMDAMSPEAATRLTTGLARPDEIPALKRSAAAAGVPTAMRRPFAAQPRSLPASARPRKIALAAPAVSSPAAPSVAASSPPVGMPVAPAGRPKGSSLPGK